jgi:hypothetical protein
MKSGGPRFVFSSGINKHASPITMTKLGEAQLPIWCLLMFHRKFGMQHNFEDINLTNRR